MQVVETDAVQQVCDRAFLRRGNAWIDGNSVVRQRLAPDQRIVFGSPGYFALLERLETEHRAGLLSLHGEILLELDGKNVLVTAADAAPASPTDLIPKETTR
jgi:hypothetical protein